MDPHPTGSEFRFEKRRADAVLTFVGGESIKGCFFIADGTSLHEGAERIGDLLNSETGFFPFEVQEEGGTNTVLYNRSRVITVQVFDEEAQRDPGYAVATRRFPSILLSNGQRLAPSVRAYPPHRPHPLTPSPPPPHTLP